MSNTPSAKSREEILRNAITDNNDVIPEKYDKTILSAMKQAQEQAVDEALRQAAENAKVGVKYFHEFNRDTFVDKDSILSPSSNRTPVEKERPFGYDVLQDLKDDIRILKEYLDKNINPAENRLLYNLHKAAIVLLEDKMKSNTVLPGTI